jgi:hypothetical protein
MRWIHFADHDNTWPVTNDAGETIGHIGNGGGQAPQNLFFGYDKRLCQIVRAVTKQEAESSVRERAKEADRKKIFGSIHRNILSLANDINELDPKDPRWCETFGMIRGDIEAKLMDLLEMCPLESAVESYLLFDCVKAELVLPIEHRRQDFIDGAIKALEHWLKTQFTDYMLADYGIARIC